MIRCSALLASAALVILVTPAWAECRRPPFRYMLNGDTVPVPLSVAKGETCSISWRVGGRTAIESATLTSKPRNGQASVSPSTLQYTAKANAAGTDAFAIQLCGQSPQGKGCSTLQVSVSSP